MKDEFLLIKELLNKKNYKFTSQKKIVLEVLIESNTHQNIKEIYDRIKSHNKIGLATVYRTLKIFTRLGITKEININGISYYELKIYSRKPLHIHFKCIHCNDIIDIDDSNINLELIKLNNYIEKAKNIDIEDVNIVLSGICSKCREEKNAKTSQI
ncbi:Fur family transcriptional regulator [Clostridium sp. MT-14]|uniref:Transcriptional repressor n=1 Tax=Clostridium aromativorans TaxID=2836848 RepID=A0ABS8N5P8_9CLOT|nr:transcriptional repressor [Clostridium aromativorans]MCC9295117.1 transcriptional repressor [Clostridium aromativorans]